MALLESITGIVGICALGVAWDANIQAKKARVKEFEMFYTERYWDLLDRTKSSSSEAEVAALAKLYWELSEDQIDARAYGLISDSTWKQWVDGMVNCFDREPFKTGWETLSSEEPNRFEGLRMLQAQLKSCNTVSFDRCEICRPRRYVMGLTGRD